MLPFFQDDHRLVNLILLQYGNQRMITWTVIENDVSSSQTHVRIREVSLAFKLLTTHIHRDLFHASHFDNRAFIYQL